MTGAISKASAAFRGLRTAILSVGRASMAMMVSPQGIALMAIAAAYLIYTNWDKVGPFFMQMWERIQTAFMNAWTGIVEIFSSFFGTLANVAGRILCGIKNTVTSIIKDVKDFVSSDGGGGG